MIIKTQETLPDRILREPEAYRRPHGCAGRIQPCSTGFRDIGDPAAFRALREPQQAPGQSSAQRPRNVIRCPTHRKPPAALHWRNIAVRGSGMQAPLNGRCEPVDKPGSVEDSHSSGTHVTTRL